MSFAQRTRAPLLEQRLPVPPPQTTFDTNTPDISSPLDLPPIDESAAGKKNDGLPPQGGDLTSVAPSDMTPDEQLESNRRARWVAGMALVGTCALLLLTSVALVFRSRSPDPDMVYHGGGGGAARGYSQNNGVRGDEYPANGGGGEERYGDMGRMDNGDGGGGGWGTLGSTMGFPGPNGSSGGMHTGDSSGVIPPDDDAFGQTAAGVMGLHGGDDPYDYGYKPDGQTVGGDGGQVPPSPVYNSHGNGGGVDVYEEDEEDAAVAHSVPKLYDSEEEGEGSDEDEEDGGGVLTIPKLPMDGDSMEDEEDGEEEGDGGSSSNTAVVGWGSNERKKEKTLVVTGQVGANSARTVPDAAPAPPAVVYNNAPPPPAVYQQQPPVYQQRQYSPPVVYNHGGGGNRGGTFRGVNVPNPSSYYNPYTAGRAGGWYWVPPPQQTVVAPVVQQSRTVVQPILPQPRSEEECIPHANVPFRGMSQQDRAIQEVYFSNPYKCGGTVLEVGARDGVGTSPSYYFEYALNWKSIIVEANPDMYNDLKFNRQGSKSYNGAFCTPHNGFVDSLDYYNGDFYTTSTHDERVEYSEVVKPQRGTDLETHRLNVHSVPCTSLSTILADADVTQIDVTFIRAEGEVLPILQTMDWKVRSLVIVVELSHHEEEHADNDKRDDEVRELLESHDYIEADWDIRRWCGPKVGGCLPNVIFLEKGFNPISSAALIEMYGNRRSLQQEQEDQEQEQGDEVKKEEFKR